MRGASRPSGLRTARRSGRGSSNRSIAWFLGRRRGLARRPRTTPGWWIRPWSSDDWAFASRGRLARRSTPPRQSQRGAGPPVVERRTLSRSAIVVVLLVVVGFEMARGLGRGRALRGRRPPPMPRRGGRWRTRGRATFPQPVPVSLPQRLPRRTPGGARPNKSTGRPGITTRGLLPPRGPRRQRPTAHRRCVSLFPRWTAVPTAAGQIKTHLDRQRDRRGKFLGELCPNT